MKFWSTSKDGGPYSTVDAYWLIECKRLFSVALLRFADGSRDAFHSHAFDSLSWLLSGNVEEEHLVGATVEHRPSLRPLVTRRSTFHRVVSRGTSWVLTFRGPWAKTWTEYDPQQSQVTVLTHGRRALYQVALAL